MASERASPTLADYVVIVISPALIAGLVGSLAFFLLEVMYRGQYEERLQWTVFFFVVGSVLVARISMIGEIAGRYWIYAPILGLATLAVLQTFVEYKASPAAPYRIPINIFLVLVVLWSTYQLMWDCTHIDDDGDPTAMGLLEAAGLEQGPPEDTEARDKEEAKDPDGVWGWIRRYQRYRKKKKRRRILGVWVVYFALGTLPIFGLGQALIASEDAGRRRFVFWLMSLYAGCALGLLMTTCFLSLRRYLRQRGVTMPVSMTSVWLTSGSVLVLVLLILGALLPRPSAEYRLIDLTPLGQTDKQASKFSPKKDASGKGEGDPGNEPGETDKGKGVEGKDKGEGGNKGDKQGKGGKDGKGGDGGDSKDGNRGNQKGQENKNGGEQNNSRDEQKSGEQNNKNSGEQNNNFSAEEKEHFAEMSSSFKDVVDSMKKLLKWLAFGIVAIIVVVSLLNGGLRYLANFTQWARDLLEWLANLWARLFGGEVSENSKKKGKREAGVVWEEARPFAWYRNPWTDGTAGQRTLQELIRFTFAALQAWAAERGVFREIGETPLEFAARIGNEVPALAPDVDRFVALFIREEYADRRLPARAAEEVRRFWERLERVTEQPMSA
jgi:hypothetical protein